mmetsp:Transcript_36008/g.84414  ORF Transcript_36008/g.84414 Transcript_36008/m.84414 type:complete len:753 (-) Transcript_36008:216-2474(-)
MPVNRARAALATIGEEISKLQQALYEEQQELNQAQSAFQSPKGQPNNVLRLNIGGECCTYSRACVGVFPHSVLAKAFGKMEVLMPRDNEGRIFLDLDPEQMRVILDWLLDVSKLGLEGVSHPMDDLENVSQAWGLRALLEFWGLPLPGQTIPPQSHQGFQVPRQPTIVEEPNLEGMRISLTSESDLLTSFCQEELSKMMPSDSELELLFRGTRDGWSTSKFARNCHHKGPMLVVASSPAGHIFGGYTDVSFSSGSCYTITGNSFLFRVSAGENLISPSQHMRNGKEMLTFTNGNGLPAFGEDFFFTQPEYAPHGELMVQAVFRNFGTSYSRHDKNTHEMYFALAEAAQVAVTELEIFQVKPKRALEYFIDGCHSLLDSAPDLDEYSKSLVAKTLHGLEAVKVARAHLERNSIGKKRVEEEMAHEGPLLYKLHAGSAHEEEQVLLNARGRLLRTFRSTLTSCRNSTLCDRFRDQWAMLSEEIVDGGVWIDEPPELFQTLLQFLRIRHLAGQDALGSLNLKDKQYLYMKRMLRNFGIHDLNPYIHKPVVMQDSSVIMTRDMLVELSGMFPEWVSSLRLLYRATRDGWIQSVFEQACYNQGATVIMARSRGGHVFGGFGNRPWGVDTDQNGFVWSNESFLFRLAGPDIPGEHTILPSKHIVSNFHCAQQTSSSSLVSFGNADLEIALDGSVQSPRLIVSKHGKHLHRSRRMALANFNIGRAYSHTSSIRGNEVYESLAEARSVELLELEVFRAVP